MAEITINGEDMLIERDGPLGEGHIVASLGSGGTVSLTATQQAGKIIEFTGTLTGNATVNFTLKDGAHYTIINSCTGDYTVTVKVTGQTGFIVEPGKRIDVICDATDLRIANSCPRSLGIGLPGASVAIGMSDADYNMTYVESQAGYIEVSGALTAGRNLVLKDTRQGFKVLFNNGTTQNVTLKTSAGTGIAVATGKRALLYCDGTNVVRITADNP